MTLIKLLNNLLFSIKCLYLHLIKLKREIQTNWFKRIINMPYYFPFGESVKRLVQEDRTPKKVFGRNKERGLHPCRPRSRSNKQINSI